MSTAGLGDDGITRLHNAMRATLRKAAERSRSVASGRLETEKGSGTRVPGRTGQPCHICGDTVLEVSFSHSSLQYCPTCRAGGAPLAGRGLSSLLRQCPAPHVPTAV